MSPEELQQVNHAFKEFFAKQGGNLMLEGAEIAAKLALVTFQLSAANKRIAELEKAA